MSISSLLILYLCFRAKQLVCDYILQNSWIAYGKSKKGLEGLKPLGLHAAGHAIGTLIITLIFAPFLGWLAIVDFFLHGAIDKLKGCFNNKLALTEKDHWFWISLGIDQEAHNLTHLAYIVMIYFSLA